jgi:hypothetical protein
VYFTASESLVNLAYLQVTHTTLNLMASSIHGQGTDQKPWRLSKSNQMHGSFFIKVWKARGHPIAPR